MAEPDLPEAYASYFELRQQGLSVGEIRAALEIPFNAWDTFIALAHAKLARTD